MGRMENGIVAQGEESVTLMTSYRFPHHGNRSFTFVQDDALTFPITSDALSSNRHSERRQECLVGMTGNGIVTQSEESITLMTPYRLIQGSWSWSSEGAAGARSAIEDTRLS